MQKHLTFCIAVPFGQLPGMTQENCALKFLPVQWTPFQVGLAICHHDRFLWSRKKEPVTFSLLSLSFLTLTDFGPVI